MTEIIGTPSIVGFTNDTCRNNGYGYNWGWSDKDQGYAHSVDLGEQTRDILHGQRFSDHINGTGHAASQVAVEKTGAAGVLATEKTTASIIVQAERIRADQSQQLNAYQLNMADRLNDIRFEQRDQACEIERRIADCCCKLEAKIGETNALILSTDAARIRDELNRLQTQMMIMQSGPGNRP